MEMRQRLRTTFLRILQVTLIGAFIVFFISLRLIKLFIPVGRGSTPAGKRVQERKSQKQDLTDEICNEGVSDSADWLLSRLAVRGGQTTPKVVGGPYSLESDELLYQLFNRRRADKAESTTSSSVELAFSTNPTIQEEVAIDTTVYNNLPGAAGRLGPHKRLQEPPLYTARDDEEQRFLEKMVASLYDPVHVPVAAPAISDPILDNMLEQAMPKIVPCWLSRTEDRAEWEFCSHNSYPKHPNVTIMTDPASLKLMNRVTDITEGWLTSRDPVALDRAIHLLTHANALPHGRDDLHASILALLGHYLHRRFKTTGRIEDLDSALSFLQVAIGLLPEDEPIKVIDALNNLGAVYMMRYEQLSEQSDLGHAISTYETLLSKTHPDPMMPHRYRINYGSALMLRYKRGGKESDLDDAIKTFEMIIAALPPRRYRSPYGTFSSWASLVHAFQSQRLREPNALETPGHLSELGGTLLSRHEVLGRTDDLLRATELLQRAWREMNPSNPDRPSLLNKVASALALRHQATGDPHDVDQAIGLYREALSTQLPRNHQRAVVLGNLGLTLLSRFYDTGDLEDVQEAIDYLEETLSLTPHGDTQRPACLTNLGRAFSGRYSRCRNRSDIDSAVTYHQECIDITGPDYQNRHLLYHNLSVTLHMRYSETKNISDLDSAISLSQKALSLCPPDHPIRSSILFCLAEPLDARWSATGNWSDLAQLIKCYREAAEICPPQHPARCEVLTAYAHALTQKYRFYHTQGLERLSQIVTVDVKVLGDTIIGLLEEASGSTSSPYVDRLHATCQWAIAGHSFERPLGRLARRHILNLLDATLSRSYSLVSRHQRLSGSGGVKNTKDVIINVAAWTMGDGHLADALEFLERGRAVLLGQISRYRMDLARLHEANPQLAGQYASLSKQMESFAIGDTQQMSLPGGSHSYMDETTSLLSEWNRVVQEIRAVDGFRQFLEPTSLGTLLSAADAGPIIFINVGRYRSDALIVCKNGMLHLVPLLDVTPAVIESLTEGLVMHVRNRREREISVILKELWEIIVEPIVDVLQDKLALPRKSRIWWCVPAAASRLPFHAAGNYARKDQNLFDLYTSSYTTTMNALVQARSAIPASSPGVPSMLVVGQPATPGQVELPAVAEEVRHVKKKFPSATALEGKEGTKKAVLDNIRQHRWVHFSCHGHVERDNPLQSHFALHDGSLSVLDLVKQSLPQAELAFLSACHSAAGDLTTPEEFLHLAAAMQFAGFRSMVGTMWAMNDEDGPRLTEAFYRRISRGSKSGEVINCSNAAEALRDAVKALRKEKVPFSRWINFVHYGI
ncbi:hypothetical protein FRB99_001979 [Tulasnella sp. 403]|nr:hypothetical protein FRB99_001979 [Tulasnella sp. 403]